MAVSLFNSGTASTHADEPDCGSVEIYPNTVTVLVGPAVELGSYRIDRHTTELPLNPAPRERFHWPYPHPFTVPGLPKRSKQRSPRWKRVAKRRRRKVLAKNHKKVMERVRMAKERVAAKVVKAARKRA